MKRNLLLGAIFATTLTLLTGCGTDEVTTVEDRNTLIVGFDAEYPPYGYMGDDGNYTGFDLEMAKLVCESLGWEYIAKPIAWASKDMELSSGTIDCIWNGFSLTPAREDQYAWSAPYVNNQQVIVVPTASGITSLDELVGLNVVVQGSSASDEAFKSAELQDWVATFGSLVEDPDYNTSFMKLDSGAADAVAVDIGVAEFQLANREDGLYTILDEAFFEEPYAIGFRLEDEELRDIINEEYMKLVESGIYEELANEFGIDSAMLCLFQ